LNNNKARSDMKIGLAGLEAIVTNGTASNKNGADVATNGTALLSTVFADWDTDIWEIPTGNTGNALCILEALPTLKGCRTQKSVLPGAHTYLISVSALEPFGALEIGYTPPAAQTVTITNIGAGAITLIQPTSVNYEIGDLSTLILENTNDFATFTVQPKAGLWLGNYNETILITSLEGASETIEALFSVICPPIMEDLVNGKNYEVIELVDQCWCTENLNANLYQDGSEIPFAKPYFHALYPDSAQYRIDFGLLYNYESAFPEPVRSGARTLCPEGWRFPTSEEWLRLNAYRMDDLRNPAFWITPNNYTNSELLDLRGSGFYNSGLQRFESLYSIARFWSLDEPNTGTVPCAEVTNYCTELKIVQISKLGAVSVRCVKE
jgi:uncharacterized protein (TIGR02145 family)